MTEHVVTWWPVADPDAEEELPPVASLARAMHQIHGLQMEHGQDEVGGQVEEREPGQPHRLVLLLNPMGIQL